LSQRYSQDGDIIFSVAKDQTVCAWYSANGERLGTYHGHVGAIWTVDVDPTTTLLATGAADNTIRLWEIKTGKLLKTWEFASSIKRVEFSPDGRQLLGVTEKRQGVDSTIVVYDIELDATAEQNDEYELRILCEESKATVAGFSYLSKYIISGHEDGTVSQYDGKVKGLYSNRLRDHSDGVQTGELIDSIEAHEPDMAVTDLQWSPDRTYFITSGKDKAAKVRQSYCVLPISRLTIFRPAHNCRRPKHSQNLQHRHPPQQRCDYARQGLRYSRRRPSSYGCHNYKCTTG
jgi:translation initiation factor 3 subunit I